MRGASGASEFLVLRVCVVLQKRAASDTQLSRVGWRPGTGLVEEQCSAI